MKFQKIESGSGGLLMTAFLAALFFLSGFSALLYQVIWQRMLGLFSGVDVYSVTVIVSSFMLGMGLGSMVGGYIADKIERRKLVALFAACELLISVFALISKWFYYDILYQQFPEISGSLFLMSAVLFLSLLIPTFFMGITLPLLSKALVSNSDQAAVRVGLLYSMNTLGAALGALVTVVFLIRQYGFEDSIRIGACLNFIAMIGALIFLCIFHLRDGCAAPESVNKHSSDKIRSIFPFRSWVLIYLLSGFIALGLEIVWFRIMGVMLKSTAFTFGILLFIYLLGFAIGGIAGLFFASKSRNPERHFLILQSFIAIYAVLSISFFISYVDKISSFKIIWDYFASPINFPFAFNLKDASAEFLVMYFLVAPLLIIPSTFLMGASFPFLQKFIQSDVSDLGKRVGWLQTANIFGSTLGSIVIGLFFLAVLETTGTLKLLVSLGAVYWLLLCVGYLNGWKKWLGCFASVVVAIGVCSVVPSSTLFWSKLHGTSPYQDGLYVEDSSGLAFIKTSKGGSLSGSDLREGEAYIFIGGATESDVPYGGQHTALGLTPAMIHPLPEDVLIIGFGSGDTVFSAGGRTETKNLTSVEIVSAQFPNLQQLHSLKPYEGFRRLFEDPRFHFEFTDARTWLMRSNRKFDIIEADPLRPNMAYAGNLYSTEYFTLLKNHLKPGGYAVSWMPSGRTIQSFRAVFPYTLNVGNWMFIGSNEPVVVDRQAAINRARSVEVQSYFKNTRVDAAAIVQAELDKIIDQPQEQWHGELDINSDLFPKDEFEKPER